MLQDLHPVFMIEKLLELEKLICKDFDGVGCLRFLLGANRELNEN